MQNALPECQARAKRIFTDLAIVLIKCVCRMVPSLAIFHYRFKVTFGLTNKEGVLSHENYAKLFGSVRELYGMSRIPRFQKNIGVLYLLKTNEAFYQHFGDCKFADELEVSMGMSNIAGASFYLNAVFIDKASKKLLAIGRQKIVYTDTTGKPMRLPLYLTILFKGIENALKLPLSIALDESKEVDIAATKEEHITYMTVTTPLTNAERNVSHNEFVRLYEQSLDMFFMSRPQVSINMTSQFYKTVYGYYQYKRDFYFGDTMKISTIVNSFNHAEAYVETRFINDKTDKVHTFSRQKISLLVNS